MQNIATVERVKTLVGGILALAILIGTPILVGWLT
jgi:hypothetical protein